ncbi:YqaJ viral recombinase family protein [Bradyrhizobium sp. Pear76]|uniref:YqaJ viral recombinase family nuclease n=1 Tax=Bradyrhizobium oropedii TaxID=1571201 RepID=UPI001E2DC8BB|nr:YqaJ viral recombinase family protein [Bradyrhizobium oropedii]MCC8963719.1 YqaJ viral recombinase family protein [Bradyrhizobium oropedii]
MAIERIAIEDREQWLALRKQDVTASVAGALLGVHPYSTAYGLYLLKKGEIVEDPEETGPMRRGRLLEPVAVQMLREDRPDWTVEEYPIGYYYRDPAARIGATPDVFATNEKGEPGIVQVKSVEPGVFRREWRAESGLVEPPLWIVVQAILETKLTGRVWAAVAPMVVGFGVELPIVPIPIHDGVFERIRVEVDQFWRNVEHSRPYPPDYARDGRLISSLYPKDNGKQIDLSGDNEIGDAVVSLERAREAKKQAESSEKTAKAVINEKMKDAALALLPDGRMLSNKTTDRDGYYVNPTSFRMVKILKGR